MYTFHKIGLILLCGGALVGQAVPVPEVNFIRGDKPKEGATHYSLHLGALAGIPNGIQKKGRDGTQIYVIGVTNAPLQAGDVILGVNGKLFDGDVIETWRAAVAEAPERSKDGNLRPIRWRNGVRTTLDYYTVLPPPNLLKGETNDVDRSKTYNLGPTGLRGWIYTKPVSSLDGRQGRTTTASRQILVTHVGANSPASGIMEVNDVILGVGGKLFTDDARKSFGKAITEAEKTENRGILAVTRFRAGKTEEVQLKLRVMGSYSDTAPYDCAKSKLILDEACKSLEKEPLSDSLWGAINGLALLATGNPDYLPNLQAYARMLAGKKVQLNDSGEGCQTWDWGYMNLFLCEYYLVTGDKDVLPGIKDYTLALARGQGMYGTYGHGGAAKTVDGKFHGSVPPYGPMNQCGLVANLSIVMGRKCGIADPEINPAIERASKFFSYYVDKGAIPYGEHEPVAMHENNGKNSIAAIMFAAQGHHTVQAKYFSKMATAAYANRETGHTGQGFNYLWSALGANVGGPAAISAFMKEASWHLDLVRRCDGSFTYDGAEQYGPGKTDDDTYYGHSSYYGLSPAATYVLTYSIPLKKLVITGRDADIANWLDKKEVGEAKLSGRFDLDCKTKSPDELVSAFGDWSPVVRSWAAEELARRPEAPSMVPVLITMAEGKDARKRQGACEALGCLKSTNALPVLIRLLKHEDRGLRIKAAAALIKIGDAARPVLPDMLKAVADTAEPLTPIVWDDPIQLTHGKLAAALFDGLLRSSYEGVDRKLLYPAIRAVSGNADGMARATLRDGFEGCLTLEDVQALAPQIVAALDQAAPADAMFGSELRLGAMRVLAKYHFREAIPLTLKFARYQFGHGSEARMPVMMEVLKSYGTAAKPVLPQLRELLEFCKQESFPEDCKKQKVDAVAEAIAYIETAKDQPELRSLKK